MPASRYNLVRLCGLKSIFINTFYLFMLARQTLPKKTKHFFGCLSVCVWLCVCGYAWGLLLALGLGVYCAKSKFSSQISRAAANASGNWKKAAFVFEGCRKQGGGNIREKVTRGGDSFVALKSFCSGTLCNLIDLLICLKVHNRAHNIFIIFNN